jgi:hypothetical protein
LIEIGILRRIRGLDVGEKEGIIEALKVGSVSGSEGGGIGGEWKAAESFGL